MTACIRCGADTELYYHNNPMCLRCSGSLEREIQQRNSQIAKNPLASDGCTYSEDLNGAASALAMGVGRAQASPQYLKRRG